MMAPEVLCDGSALSPRDIAAAPTQAPSTAVGQKMLQHISFHVIETATDEDLLLTYRGTGDKRAFEALVHRYEGELLGYLQNYLGHAADASDALQNTWLQVHLKCAQFDSGRRVRPWLFTIATHQAIDLHRRRRVRRMISLDHPAADPADERGIDELSPLGALMIDAHAQSVEDLLADKEQYSNVLDALNRLPVPLQRVVSLVHLQGLLYREAAAILGVPVGTVKSRLHHAITQLHAELLASVPDPAAAAA